MKVSACRALCTLVGCGIFGMTAAAATFSIAATGSITFGTIPNVSYTVVNSSLGHDESAIETASLTYDPSSFSWHNGTLSYSFGPATGSATIPPPLPTLNVASSDYFADYYTYIQVTNNNNYSGDVPIAAGLNSFTGTTTSEPSTSSSSQAWVEAIFQLELGLPATLAVGDSCEPGICTAFTSQDISTWVDSASPSVIFSSLTVPAYSSYVVETIGGARGSAYAYNVPTTPEPETLTLVGSG